MKAIVLAALAAFALLIIWQFQGEESSEAIKTTGQNPSTTPIDANQMQALPARQDAHTPPEIPSLRGTEVDGRLYVDKAGRLVPDEQLRHLFDYFYSTVGEITFDEASAAIRQYLQTQLQQPALGQALDLLQDYIDYKTALADLERQFPVVADMDGLRAREDAVQRLRASLFSAEAHSAFFGAEEAYNAFTLERLALLRDPGLSQDETAERIEALRTGLPKDIQALLVPQIHQQLSDETDALQARGADDWELRELRLSLVGPEATSRLEALDQERAHWQKRIDAFDRERQSILAFPGLAEQDKQAAIDNLLEDGFAPHERLRVKAMLDAS